MTNELELKMISKGAGYYFLGNGAGFALDYLFIIIITRFVDSSIVGLFFIIITLINILSIISRIGLNEGVLRYVALYNSQDNREKAKAIYLLSLYIVLGVSVILSLVIGWQSNFIAGLFHVPKASHLIRIFLLSMPLVAISKILLSVFQSLKEVKKMAYLQGFILPISMIIIFFILHVFGRDTISLFLAYFSSYLLVCSLAYKMINKLFDNIQPNYMGLDYQKVLQFSLPLAFVGILSLVNGQIDILILGWLRKTSEVSIYVVAFKLSLICVAFLGAFNYIFSPIIVELHNQKELIRLEEIFKVLTRWLLILSLPVYFVLVTSPGAILVMFGKSYVYGALPLIILCSGQLVNMGTGSVGPILTMTGKSVVALVNTILFIIMNVIFDLYWVPGYGVLGAALSYAISISVINLVKLMQVYFFFRIHPYSNRLIFPIIGISIAFAFNYFLRISMPPSIINMLIYSIIGLIFYAIIVFYFAIKEEDVKIFNYLKGRLTEKTRVLFNME